MIKTGLTSVTFRSLSPKDIIGLAKDARLDGIEWGSDIHVPPGDFKTARAIRIETLKAGLTISSYGSYYRCDDQSGNFTNTLETAKGLGAPAIRIWAGDRGSREADQNYRDLIANRIRQAVLQAQATGITIALECHDNSLTDTIESTNKLLTEVNQPELKLYWQPRIARSVREQVLDLEATLPHLANVHLFHWGAGGWADRLALREGVESWNQYLKTIFKAKGDRYVLVEFVKADEPEQLIKDAQVLHNLLMEARQYNCYE